MSVDCRPSREGGREGEKEGEGEEEEGGAGERGRGRRKREGEERGGRGGGSKLITRAFSLLLKISISSIGCRLSSVPLPTTIYCTCSYTFYRCTCTL